MKLFIKKIAFFTVFCLLITLIPAVIIDPYNIFHWKDYRDNGIEPNKNYIKMKYILSEPEKFDSYIFGSSRVGVIHVENMDNANCYNMTYSIGIPSEHLDNIKTFFENGIYPEKIYIGVDNFSYTEDPNTHLKQALRCPYEYLNDNIINLTKMYIDPVLIRDSLSTIIDNGGVYDGDDTFYEYGWWGDYDLVPLSDNAENLYPSVGSYDGMEQALADIKEIVSLCNDNNVETVFFTNPLHHITYKAALNQGYLVFLKKLAKITNYYNFSGLNDITTDNSNYWDTSHYLPSVGDLMIDTFYKGIQHKGLYEQGFGVYVTEENVDNLIELLSQKNNES